MKDPLANPLTRSRLLRLGAGGAAALGLAPLIAACGDDDSGDTSSAASSAAPEATSAPATSAEATTEAATSAAESSAATTEAATSAASSAEATGAAVTQEIGGTAKMWWWGQTEAVGIEDWINETIQMFKDQFQGEIDPTLLGTDVILTAFPEAAAAGKPADVQFLFNGIYNMESVWLGYLDPLDDYLSPDTIQNGGGTVQSVFEGKTYRVGFYALGFGMPYNKELFTQAGLDPEAPPTTWDDLLAACEALKGAGITPIGAGNKDGFFGEWYFVNSLTQNLDSPADALNLFIGELDWNDPKYHEHWVKLRELRDKGYINDDVGSLDLYQGLNLFDTGKAGMCLNNTAALPNSQKQLGDKLGFMIMPVFGTGAMAGKPIVDTQGFGIPADAAEKGTAAAFIEFMHTPERLQAMWTKSKQIPADTRFDSSVVDDPFIKTVYDNWMGASPNVYIADLMPGLFYTDAMVAGGQKILAGEMTGEEAGNLAADVTQRWKSQNPDMVDNYTKWATDLSA